MDGKRIKLHEPAVDFIDNRLPTIHGGFANDDLVYYPPIRRYTHRALIPMPTPEVGQAGPVDAAAQKALGTDKHFLPEQAYLTQALTRLPTMDSELDPKWDVRTETTWAGVLAIAVKAQELYTNPTGRSGKVRQVFRTITKKSRFVEPYVAAIPSGTWTAPIGAILSLILTAARQSTQVTMELNEAMRTLDTRVHDIDHCLYIYRGSQRVEQAALALTVSIVAAVEAMIAFYRSSSGRRFGSAIARGKEYQSALLDRVAEISTASQHLAHEANKKHQATTHAVEQKQDTLIESAVDIRLELVAMYNGMLGVFRDYDRGQEEMIELLRNIPKGKKHPQVHVSTLINALNHPVDIDEDDISYYLGNRALMDPDLKDKAAWLVRCPQVEGWMTASSSRELLVHGNAESDFDGDTSVTSFVSAVLCRLFKLQSPVIVISFFCDQNTRRGDPNCGGTGLLRALIAHLLDSAKLDLAFLTPYLIQGVRDSDLHALHDVFTNLVWQLEGRILICVIDGVDVYETRERRDDFYYALRAVLDLVADADLPVVMKVLVTSPTTTSQVHRAFHEANKVFVPVELDGVETEVGEFSVEDTVGLYSREMQAYSRGEISEGHHRGRTWSDDE
ncbi:hypothetical protein BJY04DRAFT_221327 [Aspergillus karnatakaensis]|uniref:uncharacterized protein n=1 Tax=Aspergillus karnatakaensis TaxID=1810916 RepID=UPI003CCE51DB